LEKPVEHLKKTIKEHEKAIRNNSNTTYATASHAKNTGHNFDTSNPTILARENNWNKRLWLEACYIKSSRCLNGNIGKRSLSDAWLPLLKKFRSSQPSKKT